MLQSFVSIFTTVKTDIWFQLELDIKNEINFVWSDGGSK